MASQDGTAVKAAESNGLLIVGLGASAGGQDAIERFLNHMPSDSGMAFVVVQHLAPSFDSLLVDLLTRHTHMAVCHAQDCMAVEPNRVYVIPPHRDLDVVDATFHLPEQDRSNGMRLPVDYFFRSLARDRKARAVGIILSGSGTDGSLGLLAIKENGGMVLAQEPKSATWDSMPRSAISTGMVDFVLPPQEMPDRLLAYAWHPYVRTPEAIVPPGDPSREWLAKILILLRTETGHDFSLYKSATIGRRIARRMALQQVKRVEDYCRYLQATPKELGTLFRELLISVTAFFRDPDAFAGLEQGAIRPLLQGRPSGGSLRVWVPGCATGEEAYSIAMLLVEQAEALKQDVQARIFGTDLDGAVIARARQGYYPASIAGSVGPERLQRFFTSQKDRYRVSEHLRSMVLFAAQSIIKDPPFSRLDLISCRNLLIYLDPVLQKEMLAIFHYALKPGGFLFLGTAETTDAHPRLFETVDRQHKLYRKTAVNRRVIGSVTPETGLVENPAGRHAAAAAGTELRQAVEKILLDQSPTSIAIDRRGEILFIHGRTGAYLEVPAGQGVPSNLFLLARDGLKAPLTCVVQTAADRREPIVYERAEVRNNGATLTVRLVATPFPEGPYAEETLLVQFHPIETGPGHEVSSAAGENRMAEQESEFQAMRENLQSSAGEMEMAYAELESAKEELRSANEAMAASREELQSTREELTTLNAEYESQMEQLLRAQADLENTLTQVDIGIIFLDRNLNIRHFNPAATRISNLIPADVGRPLSHIVSKINYREIMADAKAVVDLMISKEAEIEAVDGRWYAMRILPYRTSKNLADGVILTFSEVTEQKEAESVLRSQTSLMDLGAGRLAGVVRNSCNAITVQDLDGRILAWNPAAERIYGWSEGEALKLYARDLIPEEKRGEALGVARKLAKGEVVEPFKTRRTTKHGKAVEIWLTVSSLVDANGKPYAIATSEREMAATNESALQKSLKS